MINEQRGCRKHYFECEWYIVHWNNGYNECHTSSYNLYRYCHVHYHIWILSTHEIVIGSYAWDPNNSHATNMCLHAIHTLLYRPVTTLQVDGLHKISHMEMWLLWKIHKSSVKPWRTFCVFETADNANSRVYGKNPDAKILVAFFFRFRPYDQNLISCTKN